MCYCGNEASYEECCQPHLAGNKKPENPERLMRSRYSAFCIKDIEYLVSTHHHSKQKADEREQLVSTFAHTKWLGLKVLTSEIDQSDKNSGHVEYLAFRQTKKIEQLHENARFIYENNRWYYLDGDLLPDVKLGRNEPCFCGSGKKYKKCHAS